MTDNIRDAKIDGGSGYPVADYTGYSDGAHNPSESNLSTGVFQGSLPPSDRTKDYGTDYPFPDAFPRDSTATDFGSGHSGAPDLQTNEADQAMAYREGVTDIFGHIRPPVDFKIELLDPETTLGGSAM